MSLSFISRNRMSAVGVAGLIGVTIASVPAHAGFFDQLFGGVSRPAQPPYQTPPGYNDPSSQGALPIDPSEAPPARKKLVRALAPVRQKTTELMRDKTLRVGDAVMMKDGVRVYTGPESGRHTASQFVPVEDARHVSSSERAALVAIDTTRHGVVAGGRASDTLASGRSAAVGVPVTKGFRITDARGASIRYVGP